MKLRDAIEHDSEFRDDLAAVFTAARDRCIADFEAAAPGDHPKFGYLKAKLDAIKELRFLVLKEQGS